MYGWVLASTSGLTRKAIGATRPSRPATSFRRSSSAADSTLKQRMPAASACSISDPGKHHVAGPSACGQNTGQFAARDDVEPGTQTSEDAKNAQAGVGLDGIADQGPAAGQGLAVMLKSLGEGRTGIGVDGGAEAFGDLDQIDALELQAGWAEGQTGDRVAAHRGAPGWLPLLFGAGVPSG